MSRKAEGFEARLNVAADGKTFRCDFIREGPVDYSDIGKGIECLRRATIEDALQSFIGKPLTLGHVDPSIDPDKVPAHGRVNTVGYDKDTGWFFCEGCVDTDEARAAAMTRAPSCGYNVLSKGPAGRWNNIPYNQELTAIEFHHLALEKRRVRYEEADFRLNAVTNPNGETTMFKFLRKIVGAAGTNPVTEEVEIPADTVIKTADGKDVRLNACIEAFQANETAADAEKKRLADEKAKADADAARTNAVTDDTLVLVGDRKVTIKELRAAHEARENAVKADKEKAETEARENSIAFKKLQEARDKGPVIAPYSPSDGSKSEALVRGKY